MKAIGDTLRNHPFFQPLSESQKVCAKHGIEYTETVFKHWTRGCPECAKEQEAAAKERQKQEREEVERKRLAAQIEMRLSKSNIPLRYQAKTIRGYVLQDGNERQVAMLGRLKAYALEFKGLKHSGRCLALLGNAGTGKTHLACAIGNHVIRNCGGMARFTSVAEINRLVREAKSFESEVTETQIIQAFAGYDLLIIDEVGMQSGTDAESRALFDVFNERYQRMKPTILISNLEPSGFRAAVGDRIVDRINEDGGEVLFFDWGSYRGQGTL